LDEIGDRLLRFGGCANNGSFECRPTNELWSLSLSGPGSWEQIVAEGDIPPRMNLHCAMFDAKRRRLVIHGDTRNSTTGAIEVQTWAMSLDGTPRWTRIAVSGPQNLVLGPLTAYDPIRDRILGFQYDYVDHPLVSLSLRESRISTVTLQGDAPTERIFRPVAFDPFRDRLIVVGGGVDAYEHRQDLMFAQFGRCSRDQAVALGDADESPSKIGPVLEIHSNGIRAGAEIRLALPTREPATIECFDVTGRRLSREDLAHPVSGQQVVRLRVSDNLADGVYFVRVTQGTVSANAKIVFMR